MIAPTLTVVTNNGQTFTPVPATSVVIGSYTLTPGGGGTATLGTGQSATRVHLDASGRPVVVVGDSTSTVQYAPSATVVEGQTLAPGGPPVTVGEGARATTYSIDEAGQTVAVADGVTSTLAPAGVQVFTVGDVTATARAEEYQYVVASATLAVGHAVTISGTVVELTTDAEGATLLVAGESTTTLLPAVVLGDVTSSSDASQSTATTGVSAGRTTSVAAATPGVVSAGPDPSATGGGSGAGDLRLKRWDVGVAIGVALAIGWG